MENAKKDINCKEPKEKNLLELENRIDGCDPMMQKVDVRKSLNGLVFIDLIVSMECAHKSPPPPQQSINHIESHNRFKHKHTHTRIELIFIRIYYYINRHPGAMATYIYRAIATIYNT